MSHEDLVKAFLAKGGAVKRVQAGAVTMDSRDHRLAAGYQADTVRTYECHMTGEDGTVWCEEVKAGSRKDAERIVQRRYPESRVDSVAIAGTREARIYQDVLASEEW